MVVAVDSSTFLCPDHSAAAAAVVAAPAPAPAPGVAAAVVAGGFVVESNRCLDCGR